MLIPRAAIMFVTVSPRAGLSAFPKTKWKRARHPRGSLEITSSTFALTIFVERCGRLNESWYGTLQGMERRLQVLLAFLLFITGKKNCPLYFVQSCLRTYAP